MPTIHKFSAVKIINWTINDDDLLMLGNDIEQLINSWLENCTDVDIGSTVPVSTRQEMLRLITNFMCSDRFQWVEELDD